MPFFVLGVSTMEEGAKRLNDLSVVCKTPIPWLYKNKVVGPLPYSLSAEKPSWSPFSFLISLLTEVCFPKVNADSLGLSENNHAVSWLPKLASLWLQICPDLPAQLAYIIM